MDPDGQFLLFIGFLWKSSGFFALGCAGAASTACTPCYVQDDLLPRGPVCTSLGCACRHSHVRCHPWVWTWRIHGLAWADLEYRGAVSRWERVQPVHVLHGVRPSDAPQNRNRCTWTPGQPPQCLLVAASPMVASLGDNTRALQSGSLKQDDEKRSLDSICCTWLHQVLRQEMSIFGSPIKTICSIVLDLQVL